MRTYAAWSAVMLDSHGKPGVVAVVRIAKLGLPLGNSVASWLLYHPVAVVCRVKLSIWFFMAL